MTKRQEFLKFIDELISNCEHPVEIPPNVQAYLSAIRESTDQDDKPAFTDNGAAILQYLQTTTLHMHKARDIAEGMSISSKSVSGAVRKLVTDGYVEKVGKDPVVYTITEKGKNVDFNQGEKE